MEAMFFCLSVMALLLASVVRAHGADLPEYTIYRTGTPIVIDGRLDEPAWVAAPDVGAFVFPWYQGGRKELTVTKLLWDDENLYVLFLCEDAHIWAQQTERDSPVCRDDCVEVFAAPDPDRPHNYFNIEMNVLGIFLDQHHPNGPKSREEIEWDGEGIRIATSIVGTLNDDNDVDEHWILEAAIPFRNFQPVAKNTPPEPGDVWRLGLNRLGGKTNPQFSQWSASRTPRPQFHAPDDFGRVTFSDLSSPFWKR